MTWIPQLKIGLFNGWLPLASLYALFGLYLLIIPKIIVKKLYDRSYWPKRTHYFLIPRFIIAIAYFGLITLSPMKLGTPIFIIGSVIYLAGLINFFIALFNYRNTPAGQLVTKGLYRISRNPQSVFLVVSFLGINIMIGTWSLLIFLLATITGLHYRILWEEQGLLKIYGDTYKEYMKKVPRYFLFF